MVIIQGFLQEDEEDCCGEEQAFVYAASCSGGFSASPLEQPPQNGDTAILGHLDFLH